VIDIAGLLYPAPIDAPPGVDTARAWKLESASGQAISAVGTIKSVWREEEVSSAALFVR
jgi:hypothetical protein